MKGISARLHGAGEETTFRRLDEMIVRVTTWVASGFLVLLLIAGWLGGNADHFVEALNPLVPAAVGWWMLWRGSPRAVIQLILGGLAVAVTVGLFEIGSRSGALLGLVSMGIVGSLLVRRHVVAFIAGTGAGIYLTALWWNPGDFASRDRIVESLPPALAFLLAAGLVAWLKRELVAEADRHREAADALVASERRFRTAFETSAATMALIDVKDGRFLQINSAGSELLGYSENELLQMTTADIAHPDDRAMSRGRLEKLLSGETERAQAMLRLVKSDGSVAQGLVSTALVTDPAGRPLHFVSQVVDLTEQHEAEQRLMDLLASRDELIASVSHELRTPLTVVLGYAEILLEEATRTSPNDDSLILREIVSQGTDLVAIIEDLLVFAQSDAHSLKVNPVPVDVRDQVTLVLESLQAEMAADHIVVSGPRVRALADPVRIRQVLRNLLSNAGRYGGSQIDINLAEQNGQVVIAVSDNGRGIPRRDRERIFEPYQRSQPEDGLTAAIGVGLTVARRLARLMNGDLTYEYSDGQSKFELSLPHAEPALEASGTQRQQSQIA